MGDQSFDKNEKKKKPTQRNRGWGDSYTELFYYTYYCKN